MSDSTVDDLQAAEDCIGGAVHLLDRALDHGDSSGAGAALDVLRTWCRPSCQAEGDPARCESAEPETCGCPCCDHLPTKETP